MQEDLELVDSQNKQATQNEQVDTFITKGVNALAINPVDRTAAGPIIEKAKDLPIVFLNREPEEADSACRQLTGLLQLSCQ